MTTTQQIHKFEKAGLGIAPFRVVGNFEAKYQSIPGDPNCPIQPGGTCDYCGQGIMNVFRIRSADGKEFNVGCDCVAKSGDAGLKASVNRVKTDSRHALEAAKIEAGKAILAKPEVAALLIGLAHPSPSLAKQGKTMADYVAWMMQNSGNAGKLRTIRYVTQTLLKGVA